jgi:Chaperone of endosialidase
MHQSWQKMQFAFFVLLVVAAFNVGQVKAQQGQFKIRTDAFIQIGYENYKTLAFGQSTGYPNNGGFAIEYWTGGLNFWKPWPTQGNGNYNLFLRDDGNVAIGEYGDANYKLSVPGKIRASSYIVYPSDKTLKSNIAPLSNALNKLLLLQPVTYNLNYQLPKYNNVDTTGMSLEKRKTMENDAVVKIPEESRIGLIAQDVQTVFPQLVVKDDKGKLGVNYMDLIPVLIEAIKEQQKQIDALKALIVSSKK